MCGKHFSIYDVHTFLGNVLSLYILAHATVPHFKTPGRILCNFISSKTKWVEKTMISFIKIQSENIKMTWNIRLFILYMIYNFSKCDGFAVL